MVSPMFLHDQIQVTIFCENRTQKFPSYCIPLGVHNLNCLITGVINFDYLFKVVLARTLHCKVILFPFVIKNYFVGRYFDTK